MKCRHAGRLLLLLTNLKLQPKWVKIEESSGVGVFKFCSNTRAAWRITASHPSLDVAVYRLANYEAAVQDRETQSMRVPVNAWPGHAVVQMIITNNLSTAIYSTICFCF